MVDMFEFEEGVEEVKQEEFKEASVSPFDFINAINSHKEIEFTEKEDLAYNPFLVNRGLSYFEDTILFADMMNQKHHVPNQAQFAFLLNTIKSRKRFSKWYKREKFDDLEMVKLHYNFSDKKAKAAMSVMSSAQIENIRQQKQKGGIQNGTSGRKAVHRQL